MIDELKYIQKRKHFVKANKYNAVKVTIDGRIFDSKKEAKRYQILKLLEKAGKIKDLLCQPRFELIPSFTKNEKHYRRIDYFADFKYWDIQYSRWIIEDCKGFLNEIYKIKKKLFEYKYPQFNIVEV